MRRSAVGLVLLFALFLGWKILRFQTLAYTFHDMYVFLQIATSWLDGWPFMYDNFWGDHQRIHNYYTLWLWGGFCYHLGAYGFFLIQAILLLIAYALTNQQLIRAGVPAWARYGLFAVVLLGPISLWLNDHPGMGWHTELTYLPLGLLFALSLMSPRRGWAIVAGLGITLVKEDGALLAAMIQLSYFGINHISNYPSRSLWSLIREGRFWAIILGWAVVFGAGMIWLAYLNDFAEPRLRTALSLMVQRIDTRLFWLQLGKEIAAISLLLLAAVGFMLLLFRRLAKSIAISNLLILYASGIVVLAMLNFVQSALYYGDPTTYHTLGPTWPPRFVLLWTFTAAFLTLLLLCVPLQEQALPKTVFWLAISVLFLIQVPTLYRIRPGLPDLADWKAVLQGRISPHMDKRYLEPTDLTTLQCLAAQLPQRSNVMAYPYVAPYFHRHYLVWETGRQYRPADLAIVPADEKGARKLIIPMRQPYQTIRLKGYVLHLTADLDQSLKACLESSHTEPGNY